MAFKHPHKYGLMLMAASETYQSLTPLRTTLKEHVKFFMEQDFVDDIAPQHMSLVYFSYPEKYPRAHVKALEPTIKRIVKEYLPITITVQGLEGWWETGLGVPALCWHITDLGNIPTLRKAIITALKDTIEHFNDPELDFMPHIGVALADQKHETEIRKIITASRKMQPTKITLDSAYIFYPEGPERVL